MTDTAHYQRRAERHRRLAEAATNPAVRAAHEQLAAAYQAKASLA
jgi:hypothetical protein